MNTFQAFPKIPRLYRNCTITEKLDGTNAQIHILPESEVFGDGSRIKAASRDKFISIGDDNYGFARWVEDNKVELLKLGTGRHFGEWYGKGIQHGYGLQERRYALFNTHKWSNPEIRPACCEVVPVLYDGVFSDDIVQLILTELRENGSRAVEGYMKPEGILLYHHAADQYFKILLENDEISKGK